MPQRLTDEQHIIKFAIDSQPLDSDDALDETWESRAWEALQGVGHIVATWRLGPDLRWPSSSAAQVGDTIIHFTGTYTMGECTRMTNITFPGTIEYLDSVANYKWEAEQAPVAEQVPRSLKEDIREALEEHRSRCLDDEEDFQAVMEHVLACVDRHTVK